MSRRLRFHAPVGALVIMITVGSLASVANAKGAAAKPMPQQPMYVESHGRVLQATPRLTLHIYPGGKWVARSFEKANGERREQSGWVSKSAMASLRRAINNTTFKIDKHMMCDAVATHQTTVKGGNRSVVWAAPCGSVPHDSVFALTRKVGKLVGNWGLVQSVGRLTTPLAKTELLRIDNGPAGPRRNFFGPAFTAVRLFDGGHYVASDGKTNRRGKLTAAQMKRVKKLIKSSTFQIIRAKVYCRAIPSTTTTLHVRGKTVIGWAAPCAPKPHKSVYALLEAINKPMAPRKP